MIATGTSISYGKAKIDYAIGKNIDGENVAHELIRHELYGDTPSEVIEEMVEVQDSASRHSANPFFDFVLTLSEDDTKVITTEDQAKELVEEFMEKLMLEQLGISKEQYQSMQWIAFQHDRTDNNEELKHWHILANRALSDGTLLPDFRIGTKAVAACNAICEERGLANAAIASVKNRTEIFDICMEVLGKMRVWDFNVFCQSLKACGLDTRMALNSRGEVQGYYIASSSGTEYKASTIDRKLTMGRLENTWRSIRRGQSVKPEKKDIALCLPKYHHARITHQLSKVNITRIFSPAMRLFAQGGGYSGSQTTQGNQNPDGSYSRDNDWEIEEERRNGYHR